MNIYIKFLPELFGDQQLRDKFTQYGEVISAKVIKDRDTGLSKCFGFVEMKNEKDGKEAIYSLKSWVKDDGRNVKVIESESKTMDSHKPKEKIDFAKLIEWK